MHFTKMHGLGNDFIIVNALDGNMPSNPGELARRLCHRQFAIGADGLVLIAPSPRADACMLIYNSDGSQAEMCGNALRCVAKILYETGVCARERIQIDTLGGIKTVSVVPKDGKAHLIEADMGAPCTQTEKIPVLCPHNCPVIELDGKNVQFFCISMGNPHAVTFDLFPEGENLARLGRCVETDSIFPAKTNVEFCRMEENGAIRVLVWERGAGATLACGTGACGSMYAAHRLGLVGNCARVILPGGELNIRLAENGHIFMQGPAEISYEGDVEI